MLPVLSFLWVDLDAEIEYYYNLYFFSWAGQEEILYIK